MPYYLYELVEQPIRLVKKIGAHPSFKEAGAEAKRLRSAGTYAGAVKVVFAENELEAEDLLSQAREAPPLIGDDY
ncbi:MAG: hypothetical protein PHY45_16885 [Rhodocyclaceae bacterium]|nr:hypothetical protein [Rhodocyclaceae bacterium]